MSTWHIYSATTGLFTGQTYSGPLDGLAANTPVGCAAICDVDDWEAQRVDLVSGRLVAHQPLVPPDDELQTWAWNDSAARWLAVPTLEARRRARIAEVQAAIADKEARQARPMRELMDSMLAGEVPTAACRAAFEELRNAIAELQAARREMMTAANEEQLFSVVWTQ